MKLNLRKLEQDQRGNQLHRRVSSMAAADASKFNDNHLVNGHYANIQTYDYNDARNFQSLPTSKSYCTTDENGVRLNSMDQADFRQSGN